MKHYFGVVLKPYSLENRTEIICTNLVKDMIDPIRKLHDLLPFTVNRIRGRETRLNGDRNIGYTITV